MVYYNINSMRRRMNRVFNRMWFSGEVSDTDALIEWDENCRYPRRDESSHLCDFCEFKGGENPKCTAVYWYDEPGDRGWTWHQSIIDRVLNTGICKGCSLFMEDYNGSEI